MSNFITKVDYKYQMRTYQLDQILENDGDDTDIILDDAEVDALAMIEKHLGDKYDMNQVFAQSGTARNRVILRWAKILVIYYIYERVPDEMVPERVVNNYEEVMRMLEKVEDGKSSVSGLPLKTETGDDGSSSPVTRRRWGSQQARAHDGGSPRDLNR